MCHQVYSLGLSYRHYKLDHLNYLSTHSNRFHCTFPAPPDTLSSMRSASLHSHPRTSCPSTSTSKPILRQSFGFQRNIRTRMYNLDGMSRQTEVDLWRKILPQRFVTAEALLPSKVVESGAHILDSIDTLILDCDGVLWRGSELLPHTRETLAFFRQQGKRLLFVTNNASKSRRQYVAKFQSLGLEVAPEEIVAASFAAAAYLQSIGFSKKVLLVSSSGVEDELGQAGIPFEKVEGPSEMALEDLKAIKVDESIGAVVLGHDEGFSYRKICVATAYLRERSPTEVLFVCTNPDNADSLGKGRFMPGTGCLLAAVESASQRKATVVGKGGDFLFPFLLKEYGLDPKRTLVVGDRLDTDILLGKQTGALTALPLTGVSTLEDVARAPASARPEYVIESLAVLAGFGGFGSEYLEQN